MRHSTGFTLAELLIALALLGIIAAFTIPKVLQSSAQQERVAKLRETVAVLEETAMTAKIKGEFVTNGTLYSLIQPRVNAIAASNTITVSAPTAPLAGLGATHPCAVGPWMTDSGWFLLHNGVFITGTADALFASGVFPYSPIAGTDYPSLICIDVNGAASPNLPGQDIFIGNFHPWGDCDGDAGMACTRAANTKMFNWGNATTPVYPHPGNTIAPPFLGVPEERAGYWLTQ